MKQNPKASIQDAIKKTASECGSAYEKSLWTAVNKTSGELVIYLDKNFTPSEV